MSKVIANMSMSLDGFVADPSDGIDDLLGWAVTGDVEVPSANPGFTFRMSAPSAEVMREAVANVGAVVGGRRYFDLASGWGGTHPMGTTFIVTHSVPDGWPRPGSSISFVTDGVESAMRQAKEAAGDKWVAVATPDLVRQCLNLGLLDEIAVDLVPIVLGAGVPFFTNLKETPVQLDGPIVVEGTGVTHLKYRVRT
ncbi:dihydrofolate reductase family protein [Phytoactinopolyspora endophytica]|uniref:dihydrofolate reductase family protein n=1 Tax=Phytoactinopolyspora endophytica TaxID=1642495 RepID=UPI00101E1996|nr:dihydrofolate reductase family protein [Phytoactinopolyspora endophytica]